MDFARVDGQHFLGQEIQMAEKKPLGKTRTRHRRIARVVAKYKVGEQPNDFAFWQTRPYAERISALEELRYGYMMWKYGAIPRLQRVYRVVKQK